MFVDPCANCGSEGETLGPPLEGRRTIVCLSCGALKDALDPPLDPDVIGRFGEQDPGD